MTDRPRVGVSRCLLGDRVRYDGDSKPSSVVIEELAELFELVAVCPEVEAGLGVPRPPVQLAMIGDSIRMLGRDDPTLDVTASIEALCDSRIPELADLCGFICKSRSPSCGMGTTPLFQHDEEMRSTEDGIFISRFREHCPEIAVIDELGLEDPTQCSAFIEAVQTLAESTS